MCGIAGLILAKQNQDRKKEVFNMLDSMPYRGPDASGVWSSPDFKVTLGHVRLSIIDLSDSANQPFHSADGNFTIVFNGEIYNYQELAKICKRRGSLFRTNSDTEVILEMYRHFGTDCFKQFRGMWALCIYDKRKDEIVLCRDHFGIKPLYYSISDGQLYFSSEPRSLSRSVPFGRDVDDVTKTLFLDYGIVDRGQWTFYKNIKKFPQSCFVTISLKSFSSLKFIPYWNFQDFDQYDFKSLEEWVEAFKLKFNESLELHTVSDVEIGTTLSGGMDSSAITGFLAKSGKAFKTFSTNFSCIDKKIDETQFVDSLVHYVHASNIKASPLVEEFVQSLDEVIKAQGEPFGTCSILSQYFVYKLIKQNKVKVILGGQGADEILGGYDYLQRLLIKEKKTGDKLEYYSEIARYALFHHALPKIHNSFYKAGSSDQSSLLKVESFINFENSGDLEARLASLNFVPANFNDYLKFMVFEGNLPQLLRYEDRNSMFFSIESRVPFLDPELVNLCFQIPVHFRYEKGFSKLVLREAIKGFVPEDVRLRRSKLGFPGPDYQVYEEVMGEKLDFVGSKKWRGMIFDKWEKLL